MWVGEGKGSSHVIKRDEELGGSWESLMIRKWKMCPFLFPLAWIIFCGNYLKKMYTRHWQPTEKLYVLDVKCSRNLDVYWDLQTMTWHTNYIYWYIGIHVMAHPELFDLAESILYVLCWLVLTESRKTFSTRTWIMIPHIASHIWFSNYRKGEF